MPSVSSVELTNTFDDWRNRTNDIVTEINKANSVDPTSAIVFANSTSGFQVAEVVSDSVTGTLVTGTRLTFTVVILILLQQTLHHWVMYIKHIF